MPDEQTSHSIERSKDPRRIECLLHREEMDNLQKIITETQKSTTETQKDIAATRVDVGKTSGRYTAMLWFLGAIGSVLSILLILVLNKTSSIESLLSDSKVTLMQHSERIDGLRKEVDEIKARNSYIDQQQLKGLSK